MIASLAAAALAGMAASPPDLAETVDRVAREAMRQAPIAGMTIAVARGNEPVFIGGYGFANLDHDVPAAADTVYHLDSITKNVTAAAILILAEQKKLSLDDRLDRFLPGFPAGVTIRQLLNHTSGIASYTSLPDFQRRERLDVGREEILGLVRSAPPDFEPGSAWRYDNSGFYLLGLIIEKVYGQTYEEFVLSRLFESLGIAAAPCGQRNLVKHRAQGYAAAHGRSVPADPISWDAPFAGGFLCSSAPDMLRWERALEEGKVISRASLESMRRPTRLPDGARIDYGFGTRIGSLDGHRMFGHTGTGGGFGNVMVTLPDDGLSIVVLKNTEGTLSSAVIAARIVRGLLGIPERKIDDLPVSPEFARRTVGTFDSDEGTIDVADRDGRLWVRPKGAIGDGLLMKLQRDGTLVLGDDDVVRFYPANGPVLWGSEYEGGLFTGASRRTR